MSEIKWRVIPAYPDYEISETCVVRKIKTGKEIKHYNGNTVELFADKQSSTWTVHTLLASAFLGLDITDPYHNRVMFKDGDTHNTSLDNLYIEDTSDLPGEVWKPLREYGGNILEPHFEVSNKGRLKTTKHIVHTTFRDKPVERHYPDMILVTMPTKSGYLSTVLNSIDKKKVNVMIHRAVATLFCENNDIEHKIFINHIDGNKLNNCSENLEWCTPKENVDHAVKMGLLDTSKEQFKPKAFKHVESGQIYSNMSDISRAMGKWYGYVGERMKLGKACIDKEGNVWTLEPVDLPDDYDPRKISCTVDELPGQTFKSLSEASVAIGRPKEYISDQLGQNRKVKDIQGNEVHVHTSKPVNAQKKKNLFNINP